MVISSNVLKNTPKTVTITQEVGTRDISSGLEKLKSLQKKSRIIHRSYLNLFQKIWIESTTLKI